MRELVDSIARTAFKSTECIFYIDEDDVPSREMLHVLHAENDKVDVQAVIGPRITMSDCYNKAADKATGDVFMECCDSVLFKTIGWDQIVEKAFASIPDKILLAFGRDGIHDGRAATLPFLHRRWIETVGRFMPPYFSCDYCDTWVWEVAQMIGRIQYLPNVFTEHRHPVAGTAPMDKTHEERMERGYRDGVLDIFNARASERREEAALLRTVMS